MSDVNELLDIAIKETESLTAGEIFLIKDLFKGYKWNRLEHSTRLLLGTLFLNFVKKTGDNIVPIQKTSSRQQRYKRIVTKT